MVGVSVPALSPGGATLAGYFHGYPVYSAYLESLGQDLAYPGHGNLNASMAGMRVVGQRGNFLLGGVFMHQTRKPIATVQV